MDRTALITTQKKHEYPILIVDKKGEIGSALSKELKNESLVVFVSQKIIEQEENIVHIPFKKQIPTIPDNTYSHIFLIDEDLELSQKALESFVKKAKNDRCILIVCFGIEHASEKFITSLISLYDKTKIIILGEIFAKDYIYDFNNQINKFIYQAKHYGKIIIPDDGTRELSPVFFEDVIYKILEIIFSGEENTNINYLFPRRKTTLLTLAHYFKKKDPFLKVDFIKEKTTWQNNFIPLSEGSYAFSEDYNIEEKIKKINFEELVSEEPVSVKEKQAVKENRFSFVFPGLFSFLISLIFIPLVFTIIFSFIGAGFLYFAKNDITKQNFTSAKSFAFASAKSFAFAYNSMTILQKEAGLVGKKDSLTDLKQKIDLGIKASNASFYLIDASEKIRNVVSGNSKKPLEDFQYALSEAKNASYIYQTEKQTGFIPKPIMQKLTDTLNIASATIDFWPDMLGFNRQKKYLVLLQNNMELRPGGGFIGSYGILTLNKGSVSGFKIYDVYDADGQLKAHVEPPFAIRRYLPSVNWYLRDSNFNVDFSKGAVASAIFLNSEMHEAVDGVIGVDLSFISDLLSVVGPVNMPDYKVTVNSDNFFQVAQRNVETNFFPGSTQKKDFLHSFYNALSLKISESKNLSYLSLIEVLSNSFYEKHALLAFNDVNEQASFSLNGLSSSLIDQRQKDSKKVNDFIGINEANLGANKINYFITRSVSQKAQITENGDILDNLTIAFKNTADGGSKDAQNYKNYLRVVLPKDVSNLQIQINTKTQQIVPAITDPTIYEKKNFIAPKGLEVEKTIQGQNSIYGFLINVPPGEVKTVEITYQLLQKINLSSPDLSYNLRIFKQPGIDFYPYNFSLGFPESLKIVKAPEGFINKNLQEIFSTQITRDREFTINLAQQ